MYRLIFLITIFLWIYCFCMFSILQCIFVQIKFSESYWRKIVHQKKSKFYKFKVFHSILSTNVQENMRMVTVLSPLFMASLIGEFISLFIIYIISSKGNRHNKCNDRVKCQITRSICIQFHRIIWTKTTIS